MYEAVRFGNNVGHVHLEHRHRRQDADVHLLADADGDGLTVLEAGLLQVFLVERLNDQGKVGILAHGLDLLLVLVHGDDFFARLGEGLDQRRAKASKTDYAKGDR